MQNTRFINSFMALSPFSKGYRKEEKRYYGVRLKSNALGQSSVARNKEPSLPLTNTDSPAFTPTMSSYNTTASQSLTPAFPLPSSSEMKPVDDMIIYVSTKEISKGAKLYVFIEAETFKIGKALYPVEMTLQMFSLDSTKILEINSIFPLDLSNVSFENAQDSSLFIQDLARHRIVPKAMPT
jgi:hypothetical protein